MKWSGRKEPVQACQTEFQDPCDSPGTRKNLKRIMAVTRPPSWSCCCSQKKGTLKGALKRGVCCVCRCARGSSRRECCRSQSDIADVTRSARRLLVRRPSSSLSMNHVPKRLVSTAARRASVSSSTSTFPPKESFTVSKDALVKEEFNPETWAALQPPPSTALSAFAHRIGLASILTSTDLIQQVCTHSSFLTLYRHHHPTNPVSKSNAQLSLLGNSLMGLFATEYIHAKYPYLPTRVLKAAVTAHVGTASCASVAQEMGASQLLRWHRIVCRLLFYKIILFFILHIA